MAFSSRLVGRGEVIAGFYLSPCGRGRRQRRRVRGAFNSNSRSYQSQKPEQSTSTAPEYAQTETIYSSASHISPIQATAPHQHCYLKSLSKNQNSTPNDSSASANYPATSQQPSQSSTHRRPLTHFYLQQCVTSYSLPPLLCAANC